MELPEQSKFTIEELAERWGTTASYIIDIAAYLGIRVQLSGFFSASYPDTNKDKGVWQESSYIRIIEFPLSTIQVWEIFKNKKIVIDFITLTRSGEPDNRLTQYSGLNNSPIEIKFSDTYIPLRSVLAVEGKSTHRLVIDRLATHINKNDGITKQEFSEWVNKEYPDISISTANSLFTFLTLPL